MLKNIPAILAYPRHWIEGAQDAIHSAAFVAPTGQAFLRATADVRDFRRIVAENPGIASKHPYVSGEDWYGPHSNAVTIDRVDGRIGQEDRKRANALLAKATEMADRIRVYGPMQSLEPGVCGTTPRVGAFLAGNPMAMLRQSLRDNIGKPRRVFVDLSCWCGCETKMLDRRAAASIALVEALAVYGGVELCVGACGNIANRINTALWLRCGSSPFDGGRLVGAIDTVRLYRQFLYRAIYRMAGVPDDSGPRASLPLEVLAGAEDGDIVIPGLWPGEETTEALETDAKALEWLGNALGAALAPAGSGAPA